METLETVMTHATGEALVRDLLRALQAFAQGCGVLGATDTRDAWTKPPRRPVLALSLWSRSTRGTLGSNASVTVARAATPVQRGWPRAGRELAARLSARERRAARRVARPHGHGGMAFWRKQLRRRLPRCSAAESMMEGNTAAEITPSHAALPSRPLRHCAGRNACDNPETMRMSWPGKPAELPSRTCTASTVI